MNKKNMLGYAMMATAFAAAGLMVACKQKADLDASVAAAPAGTAPATASAPTAALFAQKLNDSTGMQQALSQWQGKPLIVNFWAPWCGPCVKEMPELSALASELGPKDIHVIGIGIDTPTNIAEFTSKYKITYPIYVGGLGATELSRQFGNQGGGLPYTVLIGKDGKVVKTYLGSLKFDQLRADLASM